MKFIDFLMQPEIAAEGSERVHYATPVKAALPPVDVELRNNADVYPSGAVMAKLFPERPAAPALQQLRSQTWARITAAQ